MKAGTKYLVGRTDSLTQRTNLHIVIYIRRGGSGVQRGDAPYNNETRLQITLHMQRFLTYIVQVFEIMTHNNIPRDFKGSRVSYSYDPCMIV